MLHDFAHPHPPRNPSIFCGLGGSVRAYQIFSYGLVVSGRRAAGAIGGLVPARSPTDPPGARPHPGRALRRTGASVVAAFLAARLALALFLSLLWPRPAAAQLSLGHLKSLYIERFTRFIDWPAEALPGKAPFVLCIQGSGDTASDLARVAPARAFKERSCQVRQLRAGTDLSACHVVYLASSELPRLPQVLEAVGSKPILTISDTPGFGQRGVLINLFQEDRFLRFEINLPAVKRSKLVFSSQLLRLARPVGEGAAP